MGSKEKLIERFCKLPKDFTYEETLKLLSSYGYNEHNKGATSGSRVRFKNEQTGQYIDIHKPHPGSIMKEWMMKAIFAKVCRKWWTLRAMALRWWGNPPMDWKRCRPARG